MCYYGGALHPPSIHSTEHKRKSQIKMQSIGILQVYTKRFQARASVKAAPLRLEGGLHTEIRKITKRWAPSGCSITPLADSQIKPIVILITCLESL